MLGDAIPSKKQTLIKWRRRLLMLTLAASSDNVLSHKLYIENYSILISLLTLPTYSGTLQRKELLVENLFFHTGVGCWVLVVSCPLDDLCS